MSKRRTIDPEVQAILEDVAMDPRSNLLRAPKWTVPLRHEAPVTDREALLTGAERELVKLHRWEVADLLLEEVRRALIERGGPAPQYVSADRLSEALDPVEWESRARRRLRVEAQEPGQKEALSILEKCVRTSPSVRPSPVQLAAASLRLVPRDTARICLGLALHNDGQSLSGLEALWDVIGGHPTDLMCSYAWQNIAHIERSLDHPRLVIEASRSSALAEESRGDPAMNWFAGALVQGDREEMLRSASYIAGAVPCGHPSIDEFIRACKIRAYRSSWKLSNAARRAFLAVTDLLPEQARSIGHAFSSPK